MPRLLQRLLIFILLFLPWPLLWADTCDLQLPASQPGIKQAIVQNVIDGDTVRLQDGRLVRFIGINTPEIDHETGQAEPFAKEARDYLKELLGGTHVPILLQFDKETHDRHGRLLAHVFTMDGRNIQTQMIKVGLGMWIVVPPNLRYMDCYRNAEQAARQQNTGIWNAQFKEPRDAYKLSSEDRGFQWIRGKITRIGKGRTSLWFNFGDNATLRVRKDDLHYFQNQSLTELKGKVVTVRGWMYPYKKQIVMPLRHPASMEIHK